MLSKEMATVKLEAHAKEDNVEAKRNAQADHYAS